MISDGVRWARGRQGEARGRERPEGGRGQRDGPVATACGGRGGSAGVVASHRIASHRIASHCIAHVTHLVVGGTERGLAGLDRKGLMHPGGPKGAPGRAWQRFWCPRGRRPSPSRQKAAARVFPATPAGRGTVWVWPRAPTPRPGVRRPLWRGGGGRGKKGDKKKRGKKGGPKVYKKGATARCQQWRALPTVKGERV